MQSQYVRLPASGSATASDTVDVADMARSVRRQWRAVAICVAAGVVVAGAVVLFAPPRFDGKALLLVRPGVQNSAAIGGRITGLGDLLGNLSSLGMGGSLETELQVMRSRVLAGKVVDSLQLQVQVKEPRGMAPLDIVESSALPGLFAPRKYHFSRTGGGAYRTERDGNVYELKSGEPGRLDIGTITLAEGSLPDGFTLRVLDREDAITVFGKRLTVAKAGGEVVRIIYRGEDSVSAAAAANALVRFYLDRRRTTDRGVNERRVEYVTAQLQQTGAELAKTENDLRRYQEQSRVLDAAVQGEVQLKASAELRNSLTQLQVNEAAINQLLADADAGRISPSQLASYPSLMQGSAVTPLAQQLSDFEGQRVRLLERRTERDPDVRALDSTMKLLKYNILAAARTYASSLTRQRRQLQARLDSIQNSLLALPAAAERGGRLQRDVKRLTTIYTALEAQLVDARLAAIGEGGDVKQVDVAFPQRKPAFPDPWVTMSVGSAGGLLVGVVAALFLGWFGRWLRDPVEVERAVGVSALRIRPDVPLLVAGAADAKSLLVVPLDARAQSSVGAVAQRLARTAQQRAFQAAVLDMSAAQMEGNGKPAFDVTRVATTIDQMERDNGVTIIQLPELNSDVTLAALRESRPVLLVAPPGPVDRTRLAQAVDTLRRMQIPIAGVVLSDMTGPRALL